MKNKGLNVGRLICRQPPSVLSAVGGLFDPRTSSADACRRVFRSLRPSWLPERDPIVRLNDPIHTLVCAPTGAGKNQSLIIPQLLSCRDSCIVNDIKGGENAIHTAAFRARHFGHRTVVLDPFRITGLPVAYINPFDFLKPNDPELVDQCSELANALVVREPNERDRHWNDSAVIIIAMAVLAIAAHADPHDRTLGTVRAILADPARTDRAINELVRSGIESWENIGNQAKRYRDREGDSVQTTINRHLSFLNSPLVMDHLRVSSFEPAELRHGGVTTYLVLPPHMLKSQAGLLRLWTTVFLRAVLSEGLGEDRLVHMILDELPALGHLDALETALAIGRGYGLRIQMYVQSFPQLEKCFPLGQHVTVLSNSTKVVFGISDLPTAETVSSMLGEYTLPITSGGASGGSSYSKPIGSGTGSATTSSGWSENWNLIARRMFRPDELLKLPQRVAFVFVPNMPPVMTWLSRLYEDPTLGEPTALERFTSATGRLLGSVVLLALSVLMIFVLASAAVRIATVRPVPHPKEVRSEKAVPAQNDHRNSQGGRQPADRHDGAKGPAGKR